MAKEGFEDFMKSGVSTSAFSDAIELAVATELSHGPENPAEYPQFDTYGISSLGFAISEELARVISISPEEFAFSPVAANPLVPKWVKLGNEVLKGESDSGWQKVPEEAEKRGVTISALDQDAIEMATSCVQNGVSAVRDANLVGRSIASLLDPSAQNRTGDILRNSTILITRIAMMNDTGPASAKGTNDFRKEVGAEDPSTGTISSDFLRLDLENGLVDLSPEGIELQRECSIPGEGCPALRIPVEFRSQVMPMILAFWMGGVDVIEMRLKANS